MFESIFLWLAIIAMVIVIIVCIKGCTGEMNENTIKALIIFAGVCMVLASILDRVNL